MHVQVPACGSVLCSVGWVAAWVCCAGAKPPLQITHVTHTNSQILWSGGITWMLIASIIITFFLAYFDMFDVSEGGALFLCLQSAC